MLSGDVTDALAGEVLGAIARQEDLNGRIRRNVMDTRRAVSFMMRSKMLNAEQFEEARQILRDIDSLDSHTAFLFDKINFLMDATVGFININQNKIIKIFSVASVALLPPTLIASLYGMNFQYMPELSQTWGYPYALALMVASALVPDVVLPQTRLVEVGSPCWRLTACSRPLPRGTTPVDRRSRFHGVSRLDPIAGRMCSAAHELVDDGQGVAAGDFGARTVGKSTCAVSSARSEMVRTAAKGMP